MKRTAGLKLGRIQGPEDVKAYFECVKKLATLAQRAVDCQNRVEWLEQTIPWNTQGEVQKHRVARDQASMARIEMHCCIARLLEF